MKRLLGVLAALLIAGPGFADTISGDHVMAYPGMVLNNGECYYPGGPFSQISILTGPANAPNRQAVIDLQWSMATYNGGVNFTLELLEANGLQCCGSRVIASKYMYYDDGISHKNWSIHIAYNPPQDFSTKFYYFRICSHTNGARWFSDWDTWSLSSYVVERWSSY